MKQFIKDVLQIWMDYRFDISSSKKEFWHRIGIKWYKFRRGFPEV